MTTRIVFITNNTVALITPTHISICNEVRVFNLCKRLGIRKVDNEYIEYYFSEKIDFSTDNNRLNGHSNLKPIETVNIA